MAKKNKLTKDGLIHHEMPVPDFLQAYGKTMAEHNSALTSYLGRRISDNMQTALKMSVCTSPADAVSTIAAYWQRVGQDNGELVSAMLQAPVEVQQEVSDLIDSETKIFAEGKNDVFDNSPV